MSEKRLAPGLYKMWSWTGAGGDCDLVACLRASLATTQSGGTIGSLRLCFSLAVRLCPFLPPAPMTEPDDRDQYLLDGDLHPLVVGTYS